MSDKDKQQQEWIERYLDGQLSSEEMANFEAQLKRDESLAKALSLEEAARLIISTSGRAELRNRLETFESAFEKKSAPPKVVKPIWPRWLAIAAAILILLAVSFWLFRPASRSSQNLYATYFEAYRAPSQTRGVAEEGVWEKATQAYASANFSQAAVFFEESLQDSAAITYLSQFYLGLSLLAQAPPQAQAALDAFEIVLQSDHDYRQPTLWYQALALVKLEKREEAIQVLKGLQKEGDYKKPEVEQLIQALN